MKYAQFNIRGVISDVTTELLFSNIFKVGFIICIYDLTTFNKFTKITTIIYLVTIICV